MTCAVYHDDDVAFRTISIPEIPSGTSIPETLHSITFIPEPSSGKGFLPPPFQLLFFSTDRSGKSIRIGERTNPEAKEEDLTKNASRENEEMEERHGTQSPQHVY